MNKSILYITFFLCFFLPIAHGYDFSLDALKSTLQNFYEQQSLNTIYEKAINYHDYIRQMTQNVDLNELQQNGGKRLPTLCSNDDYYYYFIHYLPTPLKSFLLNDHDDQQVFHQRYTSEERHQQFYHITKTLPPAIHNKAVAAKSELEDYISQIPFTGIHSINSNYSSTWNDYIDEMKQHIDIIKKDMDAALDNHQHKLLDYLDQGMVVVEPFGSVSNGSMHIIYHDIYEQWAADKQRLEGILKRQQQSYNQWQNKVEMGFLDTATTLGPLRQLAEDMYDCAMNNTLTILGTLLTRKQDSLMDWSTLSLSSLRALEKIILYLPTTVTLDEFNLAKETSDFIILDTLYKALDGMKSLHDARGTVRAIDSIWYKARNELVYSRWQWKYWLDLWNQEGAYSIVRFFTSSPY